MCLSVDYLNNCLTSNLWLKVYRSNESLSKHLAHLVVVYSSYSFKMCSCSKNVSETHAVKSSCFTNSVFSAPPSVSAVFLWLRIVNIVWVIALYQSAQRSKCPQSIALFIRKALSALLIHHWRDLKSYTDHGYSLHRGYAVIDNNPADSDAVGLMQGFCSPHLHSHWIVPDTLEHILYVLLCGFGYAELNWWVELVHAVFVLSTTVPKHIFT